MISGGPSSPRPFGLLLSWTQTFFFSNFSGTPGISRQKSCDVPPKSLASLGFEGQTELFWPPPHSRGRPLPHPKTSGPKSLGLGSCLLPDENKSGESDLGNRSGNFQIYNLEMISPETETVISRKYFLFFLVGNLFNSYCARWHKILLKITLWELVFIVPLKKEQFKESHVTFVI